MGEPPTSPGVHSDIAGTLFGKTRRAVLAVLYGRPGEAFYLEEIIRAVAGGRGAVQREVQRLTRAGILERTTRGNLVLYSANERCPVFGELAGLVRKTAGLADVLRAELANLAPDIDLAFIYGSQASGEARVESDVDVMVVGDVEPDALHNAVMRAEAALGRVVSYNLYRRDEFRKAAADAASEGGFLARVAEGPKIMLVGDADDV